jgi:hypothetical protein
MICPTCSGSGRINDPPPAENAALILESDLRDCVCLCGDRLGVHHCTYYCGDCAECDMFRIDTDKTPPKVAERVHPWIERTRFTWPHDRLWPDGEDPRTTPFVPGRPIR